MNPWGLTDREAAAMDAITRAGSVKNAAAFLGIPVTTLNERTKRARTKLQATGHILPLLKWDRYRQATRAFSEPA